MSFDIFSKASIPDPFSGYSVNNFRAPRNAIRKSIPRRQKYKVLFSFEGVNQSRSFFSFDQAQAFVFRMQARGADQVRGPYPEN